MFNTNSTTVASWDAELIAIRDEIFSQGGVTLREAAQMACNSIGMLADYAAEWDRDADELLLLAYAPCFAEEVQYELTAAPIAPMVALDTPAARKAAYNAAQGIAAVPTANGYLVPSSSRGNVIHLVQDGRCTCEAGQNGRSCWHVALVAMDRLAA